MVHFLRTRPLWLRIVLTIFAVISIGIASLLGIAWYALEQFASCRNVVLSSTRSRDGTKASFVFRQECNATVTDSTYASIAAADRPFVPDRNHAFLGFIGGAEVLSNWRGNDVVEIALIPGGGPFIKKEERAGTVRIDYK
jgi:hypothetical protein